MEFHVACVVCPVTMTFKDGKYLLPAEQEAIMRSNLGGQDGWYFNE